MKNVLEEDLKIISKSNLPFESYKNKTFLITGATGLIGSLLVKTLLYCNKEHKLQLKVVALIRDESKAENIFREFLPDNALQYLNADLTEDKIEFKGKIDFIIHAASITSSKVMAANPVGTIRTSVLGTEKLLNIAVAKKVKTFLYISSMEIYGQHFTKIYVDENDLGFIDITNPRSSYPESKRMCECLCNAYSSEYGLNVKSIRLAQTLGPGILENENRVFAQFAKSVLNSSDIILHTNGESKGNYVYIRDAVMAILLLLVKGGTKEAFNVSNEASHASILQMAKLVAEEIGEGKIKVVVDIPKDTAKLGYAPSVNIKLNSNKMRKLGWEPKVGLKEAYDRLIDWIKYESHDLYNK